MSFRFSVSISTLLLCVAPTLGDDPKSTSTKVSYVRQIRPLFQRHCMGCHQPAKARGDYVMISRETMLKAGNSEKLGIVPGKPEESHVLTLLTSQNGKPPEMPKNNPALAKADVELIQRWILEGAIDDSPTVSRPKVDADHPPVYHAPPVVTSVDYSPDGSLLAVSGYHEVLLYSTADWKLQHRLVGLAERIQSLKFSPDGKSIAVAGGSPGRFGEVQIWDVKRSRLKLSHMVTYDTLYGVSWAKDNTRVAFGCPDNTLRAIEVSSGKQVLFQGAHSDWVLDTVWSKDDSHLVSVSRDRSMKLTHVSTQRFIDNITSITPGALKGGLLAVARRPGKDELLIGGADGIPKTYKMFRTKARKIGDDFNRIRFFEKLPGRLFTVQYSPDGKLIVAGSSDNGKGEIRIFETDSGKKVSTLEKVQGSIYTVAFSPDGSKLASAGFEGIVRIHDTKTGKQLKEFLSVPITK